MKKLLTLLLCAGGLWAADKPNVLFIAVDDLNQALGCYGDTHAITPNIDALAKRGVLFENHFVQIAVCNPSRRTIHCL